MVPVGATGNYWLDQSPGRDQPREHPHTHSHGNRNRAAFHIQIEESSSKSSSRTNSMISYSSEEEMGELPADSLILRPFFNFFFYAFILPFKIERKEVVLGCSTGSGGGSGHQDGKYQLKKWTCHQVCCAIFQMVGMLYLTVYTSHVFLKISLENLNRLPLQLFRFLNNFGIIVQSSAFFLLIWRHEDRIVDILEKTKLSFGPTQKVFHFHQHFWRRATYAFCSLSSVYLSVLVAFEQHFVYEQIIGTAADGPTLFFPEVSIAVAKAAFVYSTSAVYAITQNFFLALALALYLVGWEFGERIRQVTTNTRGTKALGMQSFEELRQLSSLVQHAFGGQMMLFFASSLIFIAELPYFLENEDGVYMAWMAFYLLAGTIWILVGAQFHFTVRSSLMAWMDKVMMMSDEDKDNSQLKYVFDTAIANPGTSHIAMSCKLFVVTYSFMCTAVGVLGSYIFIMFQISQEEA